MAEKKEVITRPSLVIGVGGTGHETVRYLKRRFFETNNGKLPDLVKLLCFDTTAEISESILDQNGNEVLLSTNEFWNLGGYNVDRVVQNIQGMVEYKEIISWFPRDLRPGQVDQGAQITRPIGRLSLLLKEKRIRAIIREAMKSLHLIWKERYRNTKENMDVYLMSSLCGGTGSGMFLDLSYIVNLAASDEKIKSFQKIGVFLLPSAFSTKLSADLMIRAEANSYAALKELDYFMETAKFNYIPWKGKLKKIEKKPFDACYLMDTTNEDELKLEDQSSAMQLIAQSLFLKISTQIGRAGAQEENNIFGGLGVLGKSASGKITAYSAFGVAFETYPVDEIIRFCSAKLTREIIQENLLNCAVDEELIDEEAEKYLKGRAIQPDLIIERLMTEEKDGKMEQIAVRIGADRFKDYADAELVGVLKSFVDGYRRERMTRFNKIMSSKKDEIESLFSEGLDEKYHELMAESYKGFPYVRKFIAEVQADISQKQGVLREKRDGLEEKLRSRERLRDRLLQKIGEASRRFRFGKFSKKVQRLRDEFLVELVSCYNMELQLFAHNQTMEVLGELLNHTGGYLKDIDTMIRKLSLIAENIDDKGKFESERKNSIEFLLGRSVVSHSDVQDMYHEQIKNREIMATDLINHTKELYSWKDKEYDVIRDEIIAYFETKFQGFKEYSIEDILMGNGLPSLNTDKKSPSEILLNLYKRATPFWVYDAAIMDPKGDYGEELEEILVLGTEDEEESVFQGTELPFKTNITSIKDSTKIAIDRNHHGLPLFALWGMEDFESEYEGLIKEGVPLHVFKGAKDFPKITRPLVDEPEAENRELYFVLGRMFEIVYQRGLTFYMLRPHGVFEDEMEEAAIASGLEKTMDAIFRDGAMVRLLRKNVNKKLEEMGNEQAKKFIWDYMKKNREDLSRKQMEMVRDFVEQL